MVLAALFAGALQICLACLVAVKTHVLVLANDRQVLPRTRAEQVTGVRDHRCPESGARERVGGYGIVIPD